MFDVRNAVWINGAKGCWAASWVLKNGHVTTITERTFRGAARRALERLDRCGSEKVALVFEGPTLKSLRGYLLKD